MLNITEVKIDGLRNGCITDTPPIISFALDSDTPGEELKSAVIRGDDWSIETNDQLNNLYTGSMTPFTRYKLEVIAEGKSGETASAYTEFSTGRLDAPWKAKWITDGSYSFQRKLSPVPMVFRKQFNLSNATDDSRKLRRAWINSTAMGVYELQLNGMKIGNEYFAPGFTSYKHQIQYQSHDVSKMISSAAGEQQTLTAIVAGGWAVGSFNYIRRSKISARRQALLLELYLEYNDGFTEIIATDEKWEVSIEGNYRMAEWYDGETYDARINLKEINWKPADISRQRHKPLIIAEYGSPVRVQEVLKPRSRTKALSGEYIYDFGQNFAGVISAKITGTEGQIVVFRHAEVLCNGELFVKSLRTAKATATYICTEGTQEYTPRLTYMGFRYVGVSGIAPENLKLEAFVLHSDLEETGSFECSNELVNKLQNNIRWGGKSNFVDIPTDCPQRDERQGWTGDLAMFAGTACWNFDMSRFYNKWLMDMKAEQGRGGGIPMVVPQGGFRWPVMASSAWGDSCIIVPWVEYLARGNIEILRRNYPVMKKFMKAVKWWSAFLSVGLNRRNIWRFPFHWGDWCATEGLAKDWLARGKWVATAFHANSCGLMADIADLLGESEDAGIYRRRREKIIRAYRKVFTDGAGRLKKEFQTAYVLPLHFNMTCCDETKNMTENLVRLIREAGNHLSTGFTGTPYLLFSLSDNGRTDVAYDLLLQESCPSWLYEVKAGGTTIWERWDALRPDGTVNVADLGGKKTDEESSGGMVSFNHYANGAVGDWLYRRVAGIEALSGGFKSFRIAPLPGGDLTFARGSVKCPFGKIVADWKVNNNDFSITVTVPVSTVCQLVMPDGSEHILQSGVYDFSCSLE